MRDTNPRPIELTDHDLERALIALVFLDNSNLDRLGGLGPDDLSDYALRSILAAALAVRESGKPVTLVTLKSRLDGMQLEDGSGATELLRSLAFAPGTMPAVEEIAAELRVLAVRRRLTDYLRSLTALSADRSQPMAVVAGDAVGRLNDHLSEINTEARTLFNMESLAEAIAWLKTGEDPIEITTGLRDLDLATGGWHRGQFAIIAGRPSMGKTMLALASMLRTAEKGYGVLFFSLEKSKRELQLRALADYAYIKDDPIAYSDMRPTMVGERRMARLEDAERRLRAIPIEIEPKTGLTAVDLMATARKVQGEFRERNIDLALVVVDHLLKVRPSNRYKGQPVKELDEISEAMVVMAKTLNVAVVGVHQLNRQSEGRENPRPLLNDLRGSGGLEQDADVVLFPFRPAYRLERQKQEIEDAGERFEEQAKLDAVKNLMEIQIAKQRNGPLSTLGFFCDMQANVVRRRDYAKGVVGANQ